jgi:hypothetical protein
MLTPMRKVTIGTVYFPVCHWIAWMIAEHVGALLSPESCYSPSQR